MDRTVQDLLDLDECNPAEKQADSYDTRHDNDLYDNDLYDDEHERRNTMCTILHTAMAPTENGGNGGLLRPCLVPSRTGLVPGSTGVRLLLRIPEHCTSDTDFLRLFIQLLPSQ